MSHVPHRFVPPLGRHSAKGTSMSMFKWDVIDPAPGEAVAPNQRLPWGKTVGVGAQHVVAMFGATFVFPLVMGLDPNLAIMFSGICTILFLLITSNKVPSYLGTSASFVGGVVAIRTQGGDSSDVTGAIMVAGLVLLAVGVLVHFAGSGVIHRVLPPADHGRGWSCARVSDRDRLRVRDCLFTWARFLHGDVRLDRGRCFRGRLLPPLGLKPAISSCPLARLNST